MTPARSQTTEDLPSARSGTDRGAALVEYALLVALIALVCVAAITVFGQNAGGDLTDSASEVRSATN